MAHFEDIQHKNGSATPAEPAKADPTPQNVKSEAAFDTAGIDSLLVFWPDQLIDLSRTVSAHGEVGAKGDSLLSTLLVGSVIHGHPHEAAVVIVGTIKDLNADGPFGGIESNRLLIVGCTLGAPDELHAMDAPASLKLDDSPIWLSMSHLCSHAKLPTVASVHFKRTFVNDGNVDLGAACSPQSPCAVNVISYSVPNARMLQYFALESLRLAPVSGMKLVSTASALLVPDAQLSTYSRLLAANSAPSELQKKFLQLLMLDPLHWRSSRSVNPHKGHLPRGTALRRAVAFINRLQSLYERLDASTASRRTNDARNGTAHPSRHGIKTSTRTSLLTRIGDATTSAALAVQGALQHPLYTAKEQVITMDGLARRPAGPKPRSWSLTSVSASARQLNVRISQLVVAPRLASRLRYLRKQQKLPIGQIAAPYIGLWNAVWLIANDIILGHAASVLLLQYRSQLAQLIRTLSQRYLLESVLWLLSWLEHWPAGLKLNTELSLFFSDAYSSLTIAWHTQGLVHVLPRLENIIVTMALAGRLMGVTMVLCMVQDLVSICTLHITVFYTLSFRTMRAFVYVLSSLFDVFRGKKRNALRGGRLDDASYEPDQLLLGTLLFTLVAFLFPTVYVYYLAFGLIRFGVVAFEAGVVETCLALLNHLPLFALMLRVKDAHRLPAGVWLQEVDPPVKSDQLSDVHALPTGRFRLRCRPMTVADIFEGYGQHVAGLFEVPSMLLRCIFGRALRPSPPLQ